MGFKKKDRFQTQIPKGDDPKMFFCFNTETIKQAKEKLESLRINSSLRCVIIGNTPKGKELMKKRSPKFSYLVLKNGKILKPKKPLMVCGTAVDGSEVSIGLKEGRKEV